MTRMILPLLLLSLLFIPVSTVHASSLQSASLWHDVNIQESLEQLTDVNVVAKDYRLLEANMTTLEQQLFASSEVTLNLPMPDGRFQAFNLTYDPIYPRALAERYPSIRTFVGYQVGDKRQTGRFDITPQGFHAMVFYQDQWVMIDPLQKGNNQRYISYFKRTLQQAQARRYDEVLLPEIVQNMAQTPVSATMNDTLKTYRIAVAAAGEFTAFHGGTKELGLAAIVTVINRVNQVYKTDLGVRLELVGNNDSVVFTDANSDPYANDDTDLDTNESVMNTNIGSANYDIGHVMNTGGGGVAYLGVVCGNFKWGGMTGSGNPINDGFSIDYVAHEIGHQFGGQHTFNGLAGSCGTRSANDAYEPGSGSTIMAYAGICSEQNLQNNSDAFFHAHSVAQINQYIAQSGSCASTTPLNNTAPVVNAGNDYTIPANTPFVLTGQATDNDTLSYSWEQLDLGTESNSVADMVDDGSRPLFRSWLPTNSAIRYLPRLPDVLSASQTLGETMAVTNRSLNFRLIARDGAGNTASDNMVVTVTTSAGPLKVTAPNTSDSWTHSNTPTVIWDPAGTQNSPISCAEVDIHISSDGGMTFSHLIANKTPNDGSENVQVPPVNTSNARLKIQCSDNIFYAVNNGNFSITGVNPDAKPPVITGQQMISGDEDTAIAIAFADLQVTDPDSSYPTGFSMQLQPGDNYTVNGQSVMGSANFNGELSVPVIVNDGLLDSNTFNLAVTVNPVNDAPMISAIAAQVINEDTTAQVGLSDITIIDSDTSQNAQSVHVVAGDNYTFNGATYTPSANYSGFLSVNVRVNDGELDSNIFPMVVTVIAVNDAPVIQDTAIITVDEDQSITIDKSMLTIVDPDNTLAELSVSLLAGEQYTLDGSRVIPAANFNGPLLVNATVSDDELSTESQFTVTVNGVNDAPFAVNDSVSMVQDSSVVINVLANDTDVDGDQLQITSVSTNGSGTVSHDGNQISFTAATGFTGSEILTYTISDGQGASHNADVNVTVNAATAPVENNDQGGGGSVGWWLLGLMGLISYRRRLLFKKCQWESV